MNNDLLELIRNQAEITIEGLIDGSRSRLEADEWAVDLYRKYGDKVVDQIRAIDFALADLIDAIPLAATPDDEREWLYDEGDFKQWYDDYKAESDSTKSLE